MSKGGMQSSGANNDLFCKCMRPTSAKYVFRNTKGEIVKEICIHFSKKSTYWHIWEANTNKIKRTFKKPIEIQD